MAKPTPVRGLGPATPMPEAARALLGARLGDLRRHLATLGTRLGSEQVHDTRVASRRLRSTLALFGGGKRARRADREIRELQDALGGVRDLQVQLEARLPGRTEALREAIPRWRKDGLNVLARLERLEPRGKLAGHRTRERLIAELEELEARVIEAQQDPSPMPMHELRKTVKRYRYSVELLEAAMPDEVADILGSLVLLQESLGALHDTDVRLELIDAHANGSAEGTDALLGRLRTDRDRQAQDVLRALEVWEDEAIALRTQVMLSASPVKRGAAPPDADRG